MMMKFLLLFVSVSTFYCCQSQREAVSKIEGSLQDVYFQRYSGGVQGAGAGINFHVQLQTPLPKDIQLTKVLFKTQQATFYPVNEKHYMATIVTRKGSRPGSESDEAVITLGESNQAELHFLVKGKKVIYPLKNVPEKEMLAYPAMNKPRE